MGKQTGKIKRMKAKPSLDKVIVKAEKVSNRSASGLIIPEKGKEKPLKGEVMAIGPGRDKDHPLTVKVGDTVLFGKFGKTEIEIEGEDYLILLEADILCSL